MTDQRSPGADDTAFQWFVGEARAVLESGSDERACVERIEVLLQRLAAGWRIADQRYETPQTGMPYGSYLLYWQENPTLCIVQDVFMPGQETGIHEHGDSWGAIAVIRGLERELQFVADPHSDRKPRHVQTSLCRAGDTSTVSSVPGEFHSVECASDEPSVSLHVYGIDIGGATRRMWDATQEQFVTFRSGYSNAEEGLPTYLATL